MKKSVVTLMLAAILPAFVPIAPASATPPDIIDVTDEIFGITDNATLILRRTHDNLGVYSASVQDVYLVAIDHRTGQETLWPVHRVRLSEEEPMQYSSKSEQMRGSVNPFAVLARGNGIMLPAKIWEQNGTAELGGTQVTIRYRDGAVYRIEATQLIDQLIASLDRLGTKIVNYPRMSPVTVKDLMVGQTFETRSCRFDTPIAQHNIAHSTVIRLLRVACNTEGVEHSLFVPVTAQPITPPRAD